MRVRFRHRFRTWDANERYPNRHSEQCVDRQHRAQRRARIETADVILSTIPLRPEDAQRLSLGLDCRIDCTAEQFVRFLVARRNAGLTNYIKDLQIQIDESPEELPLFRSQS